MNSMPRIKPWLLASLASTLLAPWLASAQIDLSLYQALHWRSIGPSRGGRVTAVAGHPARPLTFYLGATGGGVWKTTNAGASWSNISDGYFHTQTIGAIAVAPSNAEILYVGTGESPIRGVTTAAGDGVYRSTDGGHSWRHLGLAPTRHISRVVVHPKDPDIVYVAAQGAAWKPSPQRGVYRSLDGGKSWNKVLYVNATTGASALAMDPRHPRVLYAALWDHQRKPWTIRSGGPGSGLYKSEDGGDHWRTINRGLPALLGKTAITVSAADPQRLYAMIEATAGGVFRSDDGGEHWKRVNAEPGIRDRGWYYTHIYADPKQADRVYVLSSSMVTSSDGGKTFEPIRTPHGDNHDLWINPDDPRRMVEGNDGGAAVSLDGGQSWSRQDNQTTGQFYRVIADNAFPYRLYAGQQDNGGIRIPSRSFSGGIGPTDWRDPGGGESAHFAFDPDHPRLVYGTTLLGWITEYDDATRQLRSIEAYPYFGGFMPAQALKYRFNWNAPVVVSSHDPRVIYHAAQVVLKSTDRGQSWRVISPDLTRNDKTRQGTTGGPISIEGAGGEHYGTIFYLAESPSEADTLWAASDDGLVHITRDGGKHWRNITPQGMLEAQVNAIELSATHPGRAIIAATRYKFGDDTAMIYQTENYGDNWQRIDHGIPEGAFVRVVREDPAGVLYAGTESGVFTSLDQGAHWQSMQLDLPRVPITDLRIKEGDLVAATQGRGLWILDDITPLQQLDNVAKHGGFYLFKPRDPYRVQWGRRTSGVGANPPSGVLLRYSLPKAASKNILTLDILDTHGALLRSFTSNPPQQQRASLVKGVQGEAASKPLATKAGMNQAVWNLRIAPMTSVSDTIRYVSTRPYRVAPGAYVARLTLGSQTRSQSFRVRPAPWDADLPAAAWEQQQTLLRALYQLVNAVHGATNHARSLVQRIQVAIKQHAGDTDLTQRGHALIEKLQRWQDHIPQSPLPDGVEDRVSFPSHLLSTQILHVMGAADQAPPVNAGLQSRLRELQSQWAGIKARLDTLLTTDLPAFNRRLNPGEAIAPGSS